MGQSSHFTHCLVQIFKMYSVQIYFGAYWCLCSISYYQAVKFICKYFAKFSCETIRQMNDKIRKQIQDKRNNPSRIYIYIYMRTFLTVETQYTMIKPLRRVRQSVRTTERPNCRKKQVCKLIKLETSTQVIIQTQMGRIWKIE